MTLYSDIQKFKNNYLEIQKYSTLEQNVFISVTVPCTTSFIADSNVFKQVYGSIIISSISPVDFSSVTKKFAIENISNITTLNIIPLLENIGVVNVNSLSSTVITSINKKFAQVISNSITSINITSKVNIIKEIYDIDLIFDMAVGYVPTTYAEMNTKKYSDLFFLNYEQIEKKSKGFVITDQNYPIKHILNKGQNFDINFDFTIKNSIPYILDKNFPIKVVV